VAGKEKIMFARSSLCILCMAALTIAAECQEVGPPPANADALRQEIVNKLETCKITFDFRDEPVQDAIAFLGSASGVKMVLSGKLSELIKEKPAEMIVTLKLEDAPLKTALKTVLSPMNLACVYQDGALLIGLSGEILGKQAYVRVYDLRDLVMQNADFDGPDISLDGKKENALDEYIEDSRAPKNPFSDPQLLVELIRKALGKEACRQENTSILYSSGLLIVNHTAKVHQQILDLIREIRSAR
jgi:hypothetical protein